MDEVMDESLMMDCGEALRLLPFYLDDELHGLENDRLEHHLQRCGECAAQLEGEGRLRVALRQASETIHAPDRLRRRLDEALELERRRTHRGYRAWPAVAAALILGAFVWRGALINHGDNLQEAALRHSHDLPMDVVAADMGAVQRYLSTKLPFALHLPNRLEEAAQSLGGRVTKLGDRQTAYVRMDLPQGRVSVFVYEAQPGESIFEQAPRYRISGHDVSLRRVRGFTTARWLEDGLVYSIVTDLPEGDIPDILRRVSY